MGLPLKGIEVNHALGNVFLVLGLLSFAGFWFAIFWPWIRPRSRRLDEWIKELRQYSWLIGTPVGFGVLLGGMEWLISASLYNAIGIGSTTYALTQLGFRWWALRVNKLTDDVGTLTRQNCELLAQRDSQIRARCRSPVEALDKLLEGWDRDDPKNREALRQYQNIRDDVNKIINDLKTYGLWNPKVDYPEYLEKPETRKDVQGLRDYLRWVYLGFPKEGS